MTWSLMGSVPPLPRIISITPWNPSSPASVTTNEGSPRRVMIVPCTAPIAAVLSRATTTQSWQPENGCHPVWVGASSRDVRLQGSGLDQSLSVVSNCPASVSSFTPSAQIPESPWSAGSIATGGGVAGVVAFVVRRMRRRQSA